MSILETSVPVPEICQNPWDSVGTAGMMWMGPAERLRQLDKEVEEDTARDKGSEVRSSAAPMFASLLCDYLITTDSLSQGLPSPKEWLLCLSCRGCVPSA